jgi:galactokinase/mevalonate kinase-like predicted kinase
MKWDLHQFTCLSDYVIQIVPVTLKSKSIFFCLITKMLYLFFQLHLAVRGRHKEVVRNLMEKKADPNIVNSSGKLPTSLAKDKEMKNILTGKFVPPAISGNGSASAAAICGSSSASGNVTPTLLQSRKRPYSPSTSVTETPTSVPLFKDSPGI